MFAQNIFNTAAISAAALASYTLAESEAHAQDGVINWQQLTIEGLAPLSSSPLEANKDALLTISYAADHKYGDFFTFLDLDNQGTPYGEVSPRFSLGKIFDQKVRLGPIKDVLIATNLEVPPNGLSARLLYGVGVDLDIPGFSFAQVNLYKRDNFAQTGSTHQLTAIWSAPVTDKLTFQGFIDWAGREGDWAPNIIAQPQILYAITDDGRTQIGAEFDYRHNKFGVKGVNEFTPQLMLRHNF